MRDQWSKGVQWGSVAWLVYVTGSSLVRAFHPAHYGAYLPQLLPAAAWLAGLALTWTRWSRAGIRVAIVVQAVAGTVQATSYPGDMPLAWALTFWLPMSLPLIPLLFVIPDRPRLTFALVFVGRFRDALRQLAGWRWVAVAAGIVLLNHAAWSASRWDVYGVDGVLRFDPWAVLTAFLPQAVLFGLAAFPRVRSPATA
jgi:hypothetical protein